ncbi:transposable element Tc3 transposase [Trichonephila clavipes]|nr:transposable element Tc3 transposase [Trichonephila clavipes]
MCRPSDRPLSTSNRKKASGSDRSRSHITKHTTTDLVSYASFGFRWYQSTPFATERNVRKSSIASFTLDWKPVTFAPPKRHYERWTCTTTWNGIVFTNKSRFYLHHHKSCIRVWRHRDERFLNCCIVRHHTGMAPRIMVWSGIALHCPKPTVLIAGALNSQSYIFEMSEPVVLSYIQRLT